MDGRADILIVLAVVEVVKVTAQVAEGVLCPVPFIDDLHLQVNDSMPIQFRFDVKDVGCLINVFPSSIGFRFVNIRILNIFISYKQVFYLLLFHEGIAIMKGEFFAEG